MLVTRAIVYLPGADYGRADRCIDYVRACGYKFKGLVRDWATVQQMMLDDECSVAIVAEPGDLDPDRKPRVEFVSHPPNESPNGGHHWDERTQVIRRNGIK